jgi:para-nitrobenzyl esterase
MSRTLQDAWIAFAATGNPNGGGDWWPAYTAAGDTLLTFTDAGPRAGPDPLRARLDYIDQSYPEAER